MAHERDPYYIEGKKARLDDEPIENAPEVSLGELRRYDWRCGWRVADSNLKSNPDWSREQILS